MITPSYIGNLSLKCVTDIDVTDIDVTDINVTESTLNSKIIHYKDPEVYTISNFLTNEECRHFINVSKDKLQRAMVSDSSKGIFSPGRTGSNCWINHNHDNIIKQISNKIAKEVGIPIENAEAFQVVYYDVNQEYRQHFDSFDHNYSEKTLRCLQYGGQRMATALCYLNDVEEGGGTRLTKADVEIKAEKCKLLVFWNVLRNTNIKHPLSEHAGMPVIKGEKYAFNLWFRECPRTMLYREFNPDYYKNNPNNNINNPTLVENNMLNNVSNVEVIDLNNGIYKLEKFITDTEINYIKYKCIFDTARSISSCWIKKHEMTGLISRFEKLCKIDKNGFENINVVKYSAKYIHRNHFDAYDPNTDKGKQCIGSIGQRTWTITGILSSKIEYTFSSLNINTTINVGDIIFYKNTLNDNRTRNPNLIKSIINNTDKDSILIHVYIRENASNKPQFTSVTNENRVKINTENYIETYNEVLELFNSNQVNQGWHVYKSFKIITNGPPMDFLKMYVRRLIKEREEHSGNVLDIRNLTTAYNFDEYTPVIVNNVLNETTIRVFKEYYNECIKCKYFVLGDNQSNRYKSNNEAFSRFLHYELLPLIERIVGKRIQPTYTYLSAYVKGADLPAHTDRPDCEYTVSFVVDKPENVRWPIYFHKTKQSIKGKGRYNFTPPKDECIECDCEANGLMIFNGRDHIHYREKLEYDYYNILLLHYKGYND